METKQCSRCKETKCVSEFRKNKSSPNGIFHQCRFCSNLGVRLSKHRRRAKRFGVKDNLKFEQVKHLLETTKTCASCGKPNKLSLDHIIPMSKGGANSIENIQLLCTPCNSSKSDTAEGNKLRELVLYNVPKTKLVLNKEQYLDYAKTFYMQRVFTEKLNSYI